MEDIPGTINSPFFCNKYIDFNINFKDLSIEGKDNNYNCYNNNEYNNNNDNNNNNNNNNNNMNINNNYNKYNNMNMKRSFDEESDSGSNNEKKI